MKKTVTSLAILSFLVLRSHAQDGQGAANSDPNIRPAGEVVLKFERKIKIKEIKRFEDGVLELFPGDTVHLEFEEKGGSLVSPKVVPKVQYPKRTITFKMTQDESITMLYRESEIQKTVALDCEHMGMGSEEFFRTNLNPTEKGLMAGDSWPNSVWLLRLSNIEVTSRTASEVYQEKVSKRSPPNQDKSEAGGADKSATRSDSRREGNEKPKP
ncbi:hypothetical protein BH11VER1_BH11VER1_33690 [soil metagenome]